MLKFFGGNSPLVVTLNLIARILIAEDFIVTASIAGILIAEDFIVTASIAGILIAMILITRDPTFVMFRFIIFLRRTCLIGNFVLRTFSIESNDLAPSSKCHHSWWNLSPPLSLPLSRSHSLLPKALHPALHLSLLIHSSVCRCYPSLTHVAT